MRKHTFVRHGTLTLGNSEFTIQGIGDERAIINPWNYDYDGVCSDAAGVERAVIIPRNFDDGWLKATKSLFANGEGAVVIPRNYDDDGSCSDTVFVKGGHNSAELC